MLPIIRIDVAHAVALTPLHGALRLDLRYVMLNRARSRYSSMLKRARALRTIGRKAAAISSAGGARTP